MRISKSDSGSKPSACGIRADSRLVFSQVSAPNQLLPELNPSQHHGTPKKRGYVYSGRFWRTSDFQIADTIQSSKTQRSKAEDQEHISVGAGDEEDRYGGKGGDELPDV